MLKKLLCAGAVLALSASAATAAVLTFDASFEGPVYTEAGMTITATSAEPVRTDGSWYLDCCDGAPETFNLTTGGLFDLVSVYIGHVDFDDPVVWTGYRDGVEVVSTSFNTGGGTVFNFVGFTGLDLVTMSVAGIWTDPWFDDLTYNAVAAVPEPAPFALLGMGLLGIGLHSRRKR